MRAVAKARATATAGALTLMLGPWALPTHAVHPDHPVRPDHPVHSQRAPSVDLQPHRLERGPDPTIPHAQGKTIVDGDVRLRIRAGFVTFLGKSGSDYVVGTANTQHRRPRIWRITPAGTRTLLLEGHYPDDAHLSDDGRRLAVTRGYDPTRVTVVDTVRRRVVARRTFPGAVSVLDVHGSQVALGTDRNARVWHTSRNRVRTVLRRHGYRADLSNDLLATFTKDPYQGGCTRLVRFTTPARALWTSCNERIDAFSPDGQRLATVHLLSDGMGPGVVQQRTTSGTLLSRYSTSWFGTVGWEAPDTMLLEVNGKRRSAIVRCRLDACENATDPGPVRAPRVKPRTDPPARAAFRT